MVNHRAIWEADDHLHGEIVFLKVQVSQLAVELVLSVGLQLFQLLYQRPAADEALIQQSKDGRTFQDSLPESSPRTSAGLVIQGTPEQDRVHQLLFCFCSLKSLCEGKI